MNRADEQVEDARIVLESLGMDAERCNERSALVFLALLSLDPETDRAEFRKYVDRIAWESEVWCADHPTHMIHYNGVRFLGS